jgi:hypothetical protein
VKERCLGLDSPVFLREEMNQEIEKLKYRADENKESSEDQDRSPTRDDDGPSSDGDSIAGRGCRTVAAVAEGRADTR